VRKIYTSTIYVYIQHIKIYTIHNKAKLLYSIESEKISQINVSKNTKIQ
jgi:hypothetical protein